MNASLNLESASPSTAEAVDASSSLALYSSCRWRCVCSQLAARPSPRALLRAQLRAIAGWYGARRLRTLAVPVTVVHGEFDSLSPVRNGMRLAQLIPEADYVELAGVGHLVPWEAIDLLARLVEEPADARATTPLLAAE